MEIEYQIQLTYLKKLMRKQSKRWHQDMNLYFIYEIKYWSTHTAKISVQYLDEMMDDLKDFNNQR